MMKRVALSLFLISLAGPLFSQLPRKKAAGPDQKVAEAKVPYETGVAARVNHRVITKAEVWTRIKGRLPYLKGEQKTQAYQAALLSAIRDAVEDQVIEEQGVRMNDRALRKSIVDTETERLGGEAGYRAMLTERGQTGAQYVDGMIVQIRRRQVRRIQTGEAKGIGDRLRPEFMIDPTASEVRRYYRGHKQEFLSPARVQLQFVTVTEARRRWRWMLAEAKKVQEALQTQADPEVLARRYSKDPQAGKPVWMGGKDDDAVLPAKVEAFAKKAEVGAVSKPLIFARGYHVVLIKAREAEKMEPFGEAIESIRKKLRKEKAARAKTRLLLRHIRSSYIWPSELKPVLIDVFSRRR